MKNIGALLIVLGIGLTVAMMPETVTVEVTDVRTYTDAEFVSALVDAGYPVDVDSIETYDEVTDGNNLLGRPGSYIGKTSFEITTSARYEENMKYKEIYPESYYPECTIEKFVTPKDAQSRLDYINMVGVGVQYKFLDDVFLLRLENGVLPPEAAKFEAALADAVSGRSIRPYQP